MIVTVNRVIREKVNDAEGNLLEIKTSFKPLNLKIITSYKAHLIWEEQFQHIKNMDLIAFQAKVSKGLKKWEQGEADTAYIFDALRVLYCHVESSELPTFNEFISLLEPENTQDIVNALSTVLLEVQKTAAKN